MGTAGLHARGLRFAVGAKVIVDGVDLDVEPGQTVAILGPSGCGKTSLLRLIAGLEQPHVGEVRFDGEELGHVPAHRRGFGMMFQDFALFPHLNVADNVAFGLRRSPLPKRDRQRRVSDLLVTVGLGGFEKRPVESLSGGEQQRVALARAIAPEPRLLMLDEPLGSLDRGLRERLLLELKAVLAKLAIPAIYVTHDQFEAFAIADHLAVMRSGKLVRQGSPESVFRDPQTEFVARFLGFENIIDGEADGETVRTPAGEWGVQSAPGPVRVLLRGEGVSVTESAGRDTVTGSVTSTAFQGMMVRIALAAGGQALSFTLPANAALPAAGERVTLRVPSVQIIEPGQQRVASESPL